MPAPDPFRQAGRARGIEFDMSLTVDRNRDLDQLGSDLVDAVYAVLTSHGRRGGITFARLSPNDAPALFGDRFYRLERQP